MMKPFIIILFWLVLTVLAARFVPNYITGHQYDDIITPSAIQVLAQQDEVKVLVFAQSDSRAGVLVNNFLQPLLNHLPKAIVEYVNMADHPEMVQQHGIHKQGELLIITNDKPIHLTTLSYEAFFNGLKRIQIDDSQWIVFLEGLSSQSFDTKPVSGLGNWLDHLRAVNYNVTVLPFDIQLALPNNTGLLVLASPASSLDQQQIVWLEQAVDSGISLLWLVDPRTIIQQPGLALMFDVMRTDSYHEGRIIVEHFVEHEININFDRPLDMVEVLPYGTSTQSLWFNEQGQTLASTQIIDESRLMVVGDSDFLNNQQLNSGGNLEMSYRMIDWLLKYKDRIDLPTLGTDASQLHYQRHEILWFAGIMLLLIPGLLLLVAFFYWRKQKVK